jgi:ATP-dependent RNA helicase DDX6/DHH1
VDLSRCSTLVLDEADKLLTDEFIETIEEILSHFPKQRQILLFSATFPKSVKKFSDKNMPNSHSINLMDELTLVGISQCFHFYYFLFSFFTSV